MNLLELMRIEWCRFFVGVVRAIWGRVVTWRLFLCKIATPCPVLSSGCEMVYP